MKIKYILDIYELDENFPQKEDVLWEIQSSLKAAKKSVDFLWTPEEIRKWKASKINEESWYSFLNLLVENGDVLEHENERYQLA